MKGKNKFRSVIIGIVVVLLLSLLTGCNLPRESVEFWWDNLGLGEANDVIVDDGFDESEPYDYDSEPFPLEPGDSVDDAAPALTLAEELPGEVDTSVPDGTYVGITTLPDFWDNLEGGHWQGTIEENEITIIVAADGNVSGALIAMRKGDKSTPIDGCVSQINLYTEATLSGQLTETGGAIEMQITRTDEIWRSGCPSGTETKTESGNVQAQVSIIGNRIIKGAVPDYFSFETIKR